LNQIKDAARASCDRSLIQVATQGVVAMPRNVGMIDQYVRIVAGLALVAFAFQEGTSIQGWHWFGLLGFVVLLTAFFRSCPLYSAFGLSTCERQIGRP
jgi:hypothetical protein